MQKRIPPLPILLTAAAAAVAAFSLPSCGGKDSGDTAPASSSSLDPTQRSKHFDAVSAHLDLGGEVYAYLDIDGDVDKIASVFNSILNLARESAGGEMPPQLATLDMNNIATDLGISGIQALGLSSYKNGELYRNNYYLHIPEGRNGLLNIYGGDPAPFAARKLAPAGSAIVLEQDFDLKSAFDLVGSLAQKYGGSQAAAEFRKATSQPLEKGMPSMADIFDKLDSKLVVVGGIDPNNPLNLPQDIPISLPGVDLLIAFDGIGPLFTKMTDGIPANQRGQMLKEGDGYVQLSMPMPPEISSIMLPVVRHETATGRLLIATSPDYLETCLSGKTSVWDDEGFKSAMEGLPEEGNGLAFVSAEFSKEYLRIYSDAFKAMAATGEMPAGFGEMIVRLMAELGLSPDHSQGRVAVNLPEGILVTENSAASAKQGVVAAGVAVVAVFAGFTLPVYENTRMKAFEARSQAIEAEASAIEEMEQGIRESRLPRNSGAVEIAPPNELVPERTAPSGEIDLITPDGPSPE